MAFPKTYRTGAAWGLAIGATLALFSNLRNEKRAVLLLVIIGAIGLLWAAWEHKWICWNTKSIPMTLAVLGLFVLFGYIVWPPPESIPDITISKEPMSAIPISIAPQTIATILSISEDDPNNLFRLLKVNNDTDKTSIWPRGGETLSLPELIITCYIANHGDKAVFDVQLRFEVVATKAQMKKHVWKTVTIEAIPAGGKSVLYFVNESKYSVDFVLPKDSLLQIQGKLWRKRQPIRETHGEYDFFPFFLPPSQHKWVGGMIVPD